MSQTNRHSNGTTPLNMPRAGVPPLDALRPSALQKTRVEQARARLETLVDTTHRAAAEARLREEENEYLLCHLAQLVAQEITVNSLRPILRELVLFAELEREAIRRDGVGRSLLTGLRKAGIRVRLDDQGRLMIGPASALTKEWRRFIGVFRSEIIRELTQGW